MCPLWRCWQASLPHQTQPFAAPNTALSNIAQLLYRKHKKNNFQKKYVPFHDAWQASFAPTTGVPGLSLYFVFCFYLFVWF
jgi:hypothetical protein